jgi:hypothetical protein
MKSPADMKIIQIEITNACPKRCSNCTRFCGHHKEPFFMDFETFKRAIDSLKGFRGIVGIMGGEPTIHPEFEKFVEYFRDNWGYDDFSTGSYLPQSSYINHILANSYNVNYSNQRGLWTSVTPRYYRHFELIQDTFGYQLVNDHTHPSMHSTLMVTRKELGVPDDEWVKMRDNCWIQNLWSASITPKGAFFCEIAAAMDATLGGKGGWAIEPGWWKRKPADFGEQLDWCEMCSACLPMPKRDANEETDDVSPLWHQKLKEIESPKLKKGLVEEFDPKAYHADQHKIVNEVTPYLDDEEQRMGSTRRVLQPHQILSVARLTEGISDDQAARMVEDLRQGKHIDYVVSSKPEHRTLAEAAGVPFLDAAGKDGRQLLAELREQSAALDWILLMSNSVPHPAFFKLLHDCVFNPGCVYWRAPLNGEGRGRIAGLQLFNVRARSLKHGGDLFDLASSYPKRKVVKIASDIASHYDFNAARTFYRRAIKRVYWAQKRLGRSLGGLS